MNKYNKTKSEYVAIHGVFAWNQQNLAAVLKSNAKAIAKIGLVAWKEKNKIVAEKRKARKQKEIEDATIALALTNRSPHQKRLDSRRKYAAKHRELFNARQKLMHLKKINASSELIEAAEELLNQTKIHDLVMNPKKIRKVYVKKGRKPKVIKAQKGQKPL